MARHLLQFDALDTDGDAGLWVSDGTAAGTHELTGISGVNSTEGLSPADFTVVNGEVLFTGLDAAFNDGLWVTHGTAAGTSELTGISGAYTGTYGLQPSGLTVFGSEVLFSGTDTAGHDGLWVSNGTAPGTSALTGISGAFTNGLDPNALTVFGSEVLFSSTDTAGHDGLWVTNATAAGTSELT